MPVSTATTLDVSQVLAACLADIPGLRVEAYLADKSRPPVAIIGQPTIDWLDPEAGFCWATWEFPVLIVVARNSDRDAQADLARLVQAVAAALDGADLTGAGVFSIRPMDARPTVATIGGQDLPAYQLRVQVRA